MPFYIAGPYDHERYDTEELAAKISNAGGNYIAAM